MNLSAYLVMSSTCSIQKLPSYWNLSATPYSDLASKSGALSDAPYFQMLSSIIQNFITIFACTSPALNQWFLEALSWRLQYKEAINPLHSIQRCNYCFGLTFISIYQLLFSFLIPIFLMFSRSIETYTLRLTVDSEFACLLIPSLETSLVELITDIYNTLWTLVIQIKAFNISF